VFGLHIGKHRAGLGSESTYASIRAAQQHDRVQVGHGSADSVVQSVAVCAASAIVRDQLGGANSPLANRRVGEPT